MVTTYTLIDKTTLGSSQSSITFSSIPNTWTDLLVLCSIRGSVDGDGIYIRFNGSSSGYASKMLTGSGSSVSSQTPGQTDKGAVGYTTTVTSNTFGNLSIYVPNYLSSNYKSYSFDGIQEANQSSPVYGQIGCSLWSNTAEITSLTVLTDVGTLQANSSFYLYGIKNS